MTPFGTPWYLTRDLFPKEEKPVEPVLNFPKYPKITEEQWRQAKENIAAYLKMKEGR